MSLCDNTNVTIHNNEASLTVDLFGGALVDFHLNEGKINPLSFALSREQMPENNQGGAIYQGHFLCLGRWGEPSDGEKKAGVPNHGQVSNILWTLKNQADHGYGMEVNSPLEGLRVDRTVEMHNSSPVYLVRENVTNVNPLGRIYNMVQHPTLASPFLDGDTILNCNADLGFNYMFDTLPDKQISNWPQGICEEGSTYNLITREKAYNSVFSFIVKKQDPLGWISAYSPGNNLMIGYLWKRSDYPWINLWQHFADGQIRYRGMEFGTTGIHMPFHEILGFNTRILGERTFEYFDAGEKVSRHYISFLQKTPRGFKGISHIRVAEGNIIIQAIEKDLIFLPFEFENVDELL